MRLLYIYIYIYLLLRLLQLLDNLLSLINQALQSAMVTRASTDPILKRKASLILMEATTEDLSSLKAISDAGVMAEIESCDAIRISFFSFHAAGLPMTMLIGHMLVDTIASHSICGGAYFHALESGLNAFDIKSIFIQFHKATRLIRACGAGGAACSKEIRFIPLRLGNATVFAEMLILKSDVPT